MSDTGSKKDSSVKSSTDEKGRDVGSILSTPADCERADECAAGSIDRLYQVFAASAKRWELIVYPSLLAFIILAAYGFFLVYSLTSDVDRVTHSMDSITANMALVAENMNKVANNINTMTADIKTIDVSMKLMVANTHEMNSSMKAMTASMDHVRHSMAVMNNSVSRPMQFMNSFTPW
jgi:uncharacterized protein YoxC